MTLPQRPGTVLVADGNALIVTDRNKISIQITKKRLTILDLLSEGYGCKTIGGMLGISPITVRRHLQDVRTDLGERTNAGVVMRLLRAGLLT